RYLTQKQFEEHLILIKQVFNPVSLKDVISNNLPPDKLNVLITFDDGLKNNYTHAFLLLKKHHIPAVFFVTGLPSTPLPYLFNDLTDVIPYIAGEMMEIEGQAFYRKKVFLNYRFLNREGVQLASYYHKASHAERENIIRQLMSKVKSSELEKHTLYYQLMNETELKEISDHPDYDIGSHGFYHTDLSAISQEALQHELERSVKYLESVLHKKTNTIAFPYGDYNQQVVEGCAENGLQYLFRTEKETTVNTNCSLYERFTVNPFVSTINQMYYIAKNNYE
ncbi:MAG: polysaccharide deacetylase family protein, partial [Bacteroidota bacterium]